MMVKLTGAATFACGGKIYQKGDVFEVPEQVYKKNPDMFEIVEKKKKKKKTGEEEG